MPPVSTHRAAAWWCEGRHFPDPADLAAAERLVERFAAASPDCRAPASGAATALLRALGGNSPYLSDLAAREWASLIGVARDGPDATVADAMARLRATPPASPRTHVAAELRRAKRVVALAIAVADIGGAWRLDRITTALSDLAEAALRLALAHCIDAAHLAPGRGIVALAMGKLGGRELNYSSDVDLVLLHDPAAALGASATGLFTRIARDLVALMQARDADGYVFRVDLRLRPDPAATPLSVAVLAALTYYESMGQTWERAAMLRARPVAGDLALGDHFLEAIRPFVWRHGLDFPAIADLHAMKRRIDQHKGTRLIEHPDPLERVAGHDVKLGEGGIREIEFVAQTLQLVWGGRDPSLRATRTVEAISVLARSRHLTPRAAGELIAAYRFLRRVEHRLQMVADRQTHALPASAAGVAGFATFMGFADPRDFARRLVRHLERAQRRYADLFARIPATAPALAEVLDIGGLSALGFAEPDGALAIIAGWRAGPIRALRSERARGLLDSVLPGLLRALARQPEPDVALARCDRLLSALQAGVQLLSLFERNPHLMDRVADVLGAAPPLADYLASTPAALDGLLVSPDAADIARRLAARLRDARGLEETIAGTRRVVREEDFALSVATLEGRLDADAAGAARAELADCVIRALLPPVLADMARRHGVVPGGDIAVVMLGKAGGRAMLPGSDLDLMLVYDHPPDVSQSDTAGGGRALPASQWFIRAVHGFVAALTAPDGAGALYAIDMRLRPSGNKGPVAVSLAAFEHYHRRGGEAWTWERMALTRARVVAGGEALRGKLGQAILEALASAGPAASILADAAAMRARLWREAAPPGPPYALADVKPRPGGLIEVEFVAQALQLVHAGDDPTSLDPNTGAALARLVGAGALPAADGAMLAQADQAWRTVLGMVRLTQGRREDGDFPSEALLRAAHAVGLAAFDLATLRGTLDAMAARVRTAFELHVGPVPDERSRETGHERATG